VVALPSAPVDLDPRFATDQSSQRACELLVDGLVERAPSGELVPSLAERWEVLDAGRRWRFHLRPGVSFHDGSELDADDVVFTLGALVDGSLASSKRAALAAVERLEPIDRHTVDFVLREPSATLLSELTTSMGIVPAGTSPEAMRAHPIGTGPFRLATPVRDPVRLELVAFDRHWRGRPHLERVVLREVADDTTRVLELLHGSVHLVVNDLPPDMVPRLRADARFRVVESPSATFAYLGFNFRRPSLADPRVRRAIAHAIDRERLVATLWRGLGQVTETPFRPGVAGRHDGLPRLAYDPARAATLLDAAGYPDPDGPGPAPRLRLQLKTSTNEQTALQAQILQSMLATVGIALEVRTLEFATFFADVNRGSFELFTLFRTGALDPHLFRLILHSQSVPPGGQNRGYYANPRFDQLVDQAAATLDPELRAALYHEAQEIFAEDLPYVILFLRTNVAVMPATLTGYVGMPGGELRSLRQMRWETDPAGTDLPSR
jgi:peptide/nickel transport system substrate-binding protein